MQWIITTNITSTPSSVLLVLTTRNTTHIIFKPLSANFTKWSNTLKQFVRKLPANCLSVSDHFLGLTLKGLSCYLLKNEAITLRFTDFYIFIGRSSTNNNIWKNLALTHNFWPVVKIGPNPGKAVLIGKKSILVLIFISKRYLLISWRE